jgi:hypothetical protein
MQLVDSNIRITDLAKDPSMRLPLVVQKSESSSITAIFQISLTLDVLNFVFSTPSNRLLQINSHLFKSHKKRK